MPIIRIENAAWGFSHFVDALEPHRGTSHAHAYIEGRERLARALRDACLAANVPGVDSPPLVTVVFGGECVIHEDTALVIIVEGLFDRPDRPKDVRDRLARMLGEAAQAEIHPGRKVEVLVQRFNPDVDAYWRG